MLIKINISNKTFEKHLVKMGYNYKINHYEDFVSVIREKAFRDVLESITEGNIKRVFGDIEAPINYLVKKDNIVYLSEEYIKELVESNYLTVFLEEKIKDYKKNVQKNAYIVNRINKLKFHKKLENWGIKLFHRYDRELGKIFNNKSAAIYLNALSCLNSDSIQITDIEKDKLDETIDKKLKYTMITSKYNLEQLIENKLYLESHNLFKKEISDEKEFDLLIGYKKRVFDLIIDKIFDGKIIDNEIEIIEIIRESEENEIKFIYIYKGKRTEILLSEIFEEVLYYDSESL